MDITSGRMLLALLIALPSAFFVSIGLLSLYRRPVLRSTRTWASPGPPSVPVTEQLLETLSTAANPVPHVS